MAEPLCVLPVRQPDAQLLVSGKTAQLDRCFPCEPQFVGRWLAIQATTVADLMAPELRRQHFAEWAIVGVGKLVGVGYYPGFCKKPAEHLGDECERENGRAGPWVWTFKNMTQLEPIPLELQRQARGTHGHLHWVDEGRGDWWSCCPRELDQGMVDRVREARRKARGKK
jgi:hypothetical protein